MSPQTAQSLISHNKYKIQVITERLLGTYLNWNNFEVVLKTKSNRKVYVGALRQELTLMLLMYIKWTFWDFKKEVGGPYIFLKQRNVVFPLGLGLVACMHG